MGSGVSVVIVTCNRPQEVFDRAYRSVVGQSVPADEIIVVDTGTAGVCVPEGQVVLRSAGSNAAVARNLGFRYSSGRYVAFLDDDDEWSPGKLESQVGCFSEGAGIVCSPYEGSNPEVLTDCSLLVRNWVGSTSFPMVSREAFEDAGGFDEKMEANQEWDLWMRISLNHRIVRCDVPAGRKYESPDSMTSDVSRRIRGWTRLLGKHLPEYHADPDAYRRATRVFRDEMYLRHSVKGFAIGFWWTTRSRLYGLGKTH